MEQYPISTLSTFMLILIPTKFSTNMLSVFWSMSLVYVKIATGATHFTSMVDLCAIYGVTVHKFESSMLEDDPRFFDFERK